MEAKTCKTCGKSFVPSRNENVCLECLREYGDEAELKKKYGNGLYGKCPECGELKLCFENEELGKFICEDCMGV